MNWPDSLPKVELHLHLDCSLSYEVVVAIDPSVTRADYLQHYIAPAKCINLTDFLTRAQKGFALMQTKKQLQLVVHDLFKQMTADNMLYAEIRFAPLLHTQKGLTPYEVVMAVEQATAAAVKETGIEARLILCTLRHFTAAQSMETVQLVEQFKNSYVTGFDIAGDEAGFPLDSHLAAFIFAKEKSIYCTAHAGEAKGAESVWETLKKFSPSRIGHGVRSSEDKKLTAYLIRHGIHLEVCPTCNVLIDVYDAYPNHPVDTLYKAGVSIGINTDTRTITNITLNKEYQNLQDVFGWTIRDFYNCNAYALKAAFLPDAVKSMLQNKLFNAYQKADNNLQQAVAV